MLNSLKVTSVVVLALCACFCGMRVGGDEVRKLDSEQAESKQSNSEESEAKKTTEGLVVNFSLAPKKGGGRYRRPYVAVWLEDKEGFPVKTAALWLQTSAPGPRWHRDLTRWYRNDRVRKLAEKTDLIDAISGATRGPGDYSAHFDGTDNSGKALDSGKYTLCIEVAREHGTYQIIRETIEWGDKAIEKKALKPNVEISVANYSYVPVSASAAKGE